MKKITLIFAALLIGAATLSAQNAFVGGQLGFDYQFSAPIQLSLDFRPMWNLFTNGGFNYGAALGIRYAF